MEPAALELAQQVVALRVYSYAVRAQLEGLFRCAPAVDGGPYLLVGCAPGNLHELGPLMLALFLRRLGVRVALPHLLERYERLGYRMYEERFHEGYSEPTYLMMEKFL